MLYNHAKTWHVRPSALLALDDSYVAYCLDEAVAYLGRTIDGELHGVEGDTQADRNRNAQLVLDSYFGEPENKPRPGMFADPALLFK